MNLDKLKEFLDSDERQKTIDDFFNNHTESDNKGLISLING